MKCKHGLTKLNCYLCLGHKRTKLPIEHEPTNMGALTHESWLHDIVWASATREKATKSMYFKSQMTRSAY